MTIQATDADELELTRAKLRTAVRTAEEAMRLMTDWQLIELRHRLDELEQTA